MTKSLSILILSLLAFGCGNSFQAATPAGFVELEDQELHDYRATNADGLVIAVREIEHEPEGSAEFWARAIENQLRDRGGYALISSSDVKTKTGHPGKRMRFGHDESGTPHIYVVTLFVTQSTLYIMEVGGTKELVERHKEQIDWASDNFRIK